MGYNIEYVTSVYRPTRWLCYSYLGDQGAEYRRCAAATENAENACSASLMPVEGWYYPNYVTEACPGLPGHKALHECASKFASADLILKDRLVDHAADKESESDKRIKTPDLDFDVINVEPEEAQKTSG